MPSWGFRKVYHRRDDVRGIAMECSAIGVEPPEKVTLEVTMTDPGLKGNTRVWRR